MSSMLPCTLVELTPFAHMVQQSEVHNSEVHTSTALAAALALAALLTFSKTAAYSLHLHPLTTHITNCMLCMLSRWAQL